MKLGFHGVASDSAQKVFSVDSTTYLAVSGRLRTCNFQVQRARELVTELGTSDIRVLGTALAQETIPCLTALVEDMRAFQHREEMIAHAIAGRSILHACILVGRTSDGQLGMVSHAYQLVNGSVRCTTEEYFDNTRRKITATSPALPENLSASLAWTQDFTIFTDPPESVIRRILRDMRATGLSGGPDQIVCIDSEGARWIAEPPTPTTPLIGNFETATITATVSMVSPNISGGTIVGATLLLNTNGTITSVNNQPAGGGTLGNGISVKLAANNQQVFISPDGIWLLNSAGQVLGVLDVAVTGAPRGVFSVYNPANGNSILLDPDNGIFVNGVKMNVP